MVFIDTTVLCTKLATVEHRSFSWIDFLYDTELVLSWWSHPEQTCKERKDFMKQCYSNIECLEVQGLECDERSVCDCVDDQNK